MYFTHSLLRDAMILASSVPRGRLVGGTPGVLTLIFPETGAHPAYFSRDRVANCVWTPRCCRFSSKKVFALPHWKFVDLPLVPDWFAEWYHMHFNQSGGMRIDLILLLCLKLDSYYNASVFQRWVVSCSVSIQIQWHSSVIKHSCRAFSDDQ